LVCFAPVILNFDCAGFDPLVPRLPTPFLNSLLFCEPWLRGWAVPGVFFFAGLTLCDVCFLQNGQCLITVFGIFINPKELEVIYKDYP
jgi:hypothetical protein